MLKTNTDDRILGANLSWSWT